MFDYRNLDQEEKTEMVKSRAWRGLNRFMEDGEPLSLTGDFQQFLPLSFHLMDNDRFRNNFMTKKRFRTYLWLCRKIVRGNNPSDPVGVYDDYYRRGKLAVSIPLKRLRKELGLSKSTVSDHVNQLEKDGLLKIVTAVGSDGQDYNVYILGVHDRKIEDWFVNDVFGPGAKNGAGLRK